METNFDLKDNDEKNKRVCTKRVKDEKWKQLLI